MRQLPASFSDHVRRRFAERYQLAVSVDDLRRMVDCIRGGEAVLLRADVGGGRALYATPRPSRKGKNTKLAPVVYDRKCDAIVTVLPESKLLEHRAMIRAFLEKRRAELGDATWRPRYRTGNPADRPPVRLVLDPVELCYHVYCSASTCPFPVSLYVRDRRAGRREIQYLKANGVRTCGFQPALKLLRQTFQTCLAIRTGALPLDAEEKTERFIRHLLEATRREPLVWPGSACLAAAA